LHQALVLGASRFGERQLSIIERPLAVQHFEIGRRTSLVTHDGESNRLLQISYRLLLAKPDLMEFLIADQRIGDIPERELNGLPVRDQCLLLL
jgi:hypothetical protein